MADTPYSNHEILNDYILHLKLANSSPNTIKTYIPVLKDFLGTITVPVGEMTAEHVHQWLKGRGDWYKETTIATWISILSSFFTFCVIEEYIEQAPIKSRWRPRPPKPTPKYVEKGELARVRLQSETQNLRDQVLFEFLVSSGCRISEALLLNKEDVNLKERTARVKGKGNKIRPVHFSSRCAILLEKYFETLPEEVQAVFVSQRGKRLTRGGAHKIVKGMGEMAALKGSLGPHRLRHTFATTLLSKGADLAFIAEEMGHNQISTTRVYARLPKEEIVTMYRKYMG